jgi:hypothetical protein
VVSAITAPPKMTRTRLALGVTVIGWSGPGVFMEVLAVDRDNFRQISALAGIAIN